MPEKSVKSVSRRDFLKFTGLLASVAAVTTGCGPKIIDSLSAPEIPQEPALAKMTIGEGVNFQVFSAVTAAGVEFLANIADNGYVPYDLYPAGVLTSSCQQKSNQSWFGTETGDLAELGTNIWWSKDRSELTNQIFANQDLDILGAWFDNGEITGTPGMAVVVRGKVPKLVEGKLDFEGQSTEDGLAIVFFNHEDDLSKVSFSAADGADNHVANILTIMARRQAANTPFSSDAHLLDAVAIPPGLKEVYQALIQTANSPEAVIAKLQLVNPGLTQEKWLIPALDHPAVDEPEKIDLPIGQKLQLYRIISFNNQAYAAVTINNNEGNQTLVYLPINAVQVQRRPEELEDNTYDDIATEIHEKIDGFSAMTQAGQQTAEAATATAQYTPWVTFTPQPTVTLPPVYSATPTGTGGPGSAPEQVNPGAYIPFEAVAPFFSLSVVLVLTGFAWMVRASQVKK